MAVKVGPAGVYRNHCAEFHSNNYIKTRCTYTKPQKISNKSFCKDFHFFEQFYINK